MYNLSGQQETSGKDERFNGFGEGKVKYKLSANGNRCCN